MQKDVICVHIPHCMEFGGSREHVEDRAWQMVGEAIAKKLRAETTIACRVRVSEHEKDYMSRDFGSYTYTLLVDVLDVIITKHQSHIEFFERVPVQSLAALPRQARAAIDRAPVDKAVAMPSRLFDLENE